MAAHLTGRPLACAVFFVLALPSAFAAPPEMPAALANLPSDTAVAVHIPKLHYLLQDLSNVQRTVADLRPSLRNLSPSQLLSRLLWNRAEEPRSVVVPEEHGLDVDGPAVIRVDAKLRAAVAVLPVSDPEQFRRWLRAIPGPSKSRVIVQGYEVDVLAIDSALPVACVVLDSRAVCQVGASSGAGISPLTAHLRKPERSLSQVRGITRAWTKLRSSSRWTAVVRPKPLAQALARIWRNATLRAHRLDEPRSRAALARRMERIERHFVGYVRLLQAAAIGLDSSTQGSKLELVVALSDPGAGRLAALIPAAPTRPRMRRWVSTPALFSVFISVQPRLASELASHFGLEVPSDALDGSVGLLTLGVNVHSPGAKRPEFLDWAVLFPSAVTIGLRGTSAAETAYARLDERLSRMASPAKKTRPPLVGNLSGSRLEVHVLDDLLLAGTGPMGGHAAVRRLRGVDLQPPEHSSAKECSFLEAVVDLGAIDAALLAGGAERTNRRELQLLERFRQRLAPLADRVRRIRILGSREADGRSVRLKVSFGR